MITKRFLQVFFGIASTLLLFSEASHAQIKMSPLVIQTQSQKDSAKGAISFTNTSSETFRARVYAVPFTYDLTGLKELESSPQDLTPFLVLSPKELVVEPGQTRQIRLLSRFLPSTPLGEYRTVIYTEDLKEIIQENGGSTIGLKPRVGVTVYVRHGDVKANLAVQNAKLDPKNRDISLILSNSGNATARPEIQWSLSNNQGVIETGKTNSYTLIPDGKRQINLVKFDGKSFQPGNYKISGELLWEDSSKSQKLPFSVDLEIAEADLTPKAEK